MLGIISSLKSISAESYVPIVTLLLLVLLGKEANGFNVTVHTQHGYARVFEKGSSVSIEVTDGCVNVPEEFQNDVSSVDVHGNCVKLYMQKDCQSNYLIAYPPSVTQMESILMAPETLFDDDVRSIGPCEDECSQQNIQALEIVKNQTSSRTGKRPRLHLTDYHGNPKMLFLNGCVALPSSFNKLVRGMSAISPPSCLQMYSDENCNNLSKRFEPNFVRTRAQGFYWGAVTNDDSALVTGSMSLCGFNCNRNRYADLNSNSTESQIVEDIININRTTSSKVMNDGLETHAHAACSSTAVIILSVILVSIIALICAGGFIYYFYILPQKRSPTRNGRVGGWNDRLNLVSERS